MDPNRFDAMTRRLQIAHSRRRGLLFLVGGLLGPALTRLVPQGAAAACPDPLGSKCKSAADCCDSNKHRCRDGRCRCKKGWKDCDDDKSCETDITTDADHCGGCGNVCPAEKPCCIKGTCRPECNGVCCDNCFVQIDNDTGDPVPDSEVCCPPESICEHKKPGPADDRCCYDDEACVDGKCCCDGCLGSVVCGGKCCPIEACCNLGEADEKCCKKGQVCAGDPLGCVSANRDCDTAQDCKSGESCDGGTCCSGLRVCQKNAGDTFCCKADEYCEFSGTPQANCCPVNSVCASTYRQHRVRT